MSWLTGYNKRIKVTVSNTNIDSDLTHFPLLLTLGSSVGTGSDDTTCVFDELTSDANRKKIAVTKTDGTTQCYVEIEQWDDANEKAVLWVSKSDLVLSSSGTTDLYLYYDSSHADNTIYVGDVNSTAGANVWDSYYKGVWHMSEDPSGTAPQMKDSTSNSDDGTTVGSMVSGDSVSAVVGNGLDLDASSNQEVALDSGSNLTMGTDDFSWSGWFKMDAWNGTHDQQSLITHGGISDTADGFRTAFDYGSDGTDAYVWTTISDGTTRTTFTSNAGTITTGTQYFIAVTYDRDGNGVIYIDGTAADTTSITASNGNIGTDKTTQIGGYSTNGRNIDGIIDEIKVSKGIARSAAWVKAQYYSEKDNLVSWGSEEIASTDNWLNGYNKRIKVTVSNTNIDSDLTHFPLLLTLGSSVGTGSDDTTCVFDELTSDANRKKIAVTKSDGTTQLYVEIEQWDDANEKAVLWVSKSDLVLSSTGTTDLYLYYDSSHADNTTYVGDIGSRTEVWDSNYKMVQHMVDTTTSTITDSTSNNNDGTKTSANDPIEATGKIAEAQDFTKANSDKVTISNDTTLNSGTGTFTTSAWVKFDSTIGSVTATIVGRFAGGTPGWTFGKYSDDKLFFYMSDGSSSQLLRATTTTLIAGTFYYITIVRRAGNDREIYVNGSEESLNAAPANLSGNLNSTLDLGIGAYGSEYWDGIIDETRFSNGIARSADWIKASYHSETDNLVSWGSEETPTTFVPQMIFI